MTFELDKVFPPQAPQEEVRQQPSAAKDSDPRINGVSHVHPL